MKRVIFEIVKACLLGMLFLCVGLYLGTMNERKEQEAGNKQYETVETIAVVNMDEGSDIDGEMINYGSELGAFPSENFVGASLDEAKSGIYNGTYGAYIVIPPTFSESVESINDFPQKASLTYSMNPNLSDATKLIVTDEIQDFNPFADDTNGKNVLDNGFEKLEAEALLTDGTSMKNAIDTKVSEQAQIEMGYYREKL